MANAAVAAVLKDGKNELKDGKGQWTNGKQHYKDGKLKRELFQVS